MIHNFKAEGLNISEIAPEIRQLIHQLTGAFFPALRSTHRFHVPVQSPDAKTATSSIRLATTNASAQQSTRHTADRLRHATTVSSVRFDASAD